MKNKASIKLTFGCVQLILSFLYLAAQFYITFYVLKSVNADNLIWFLFWGSLPIILILKSLEEVMKNLLTEE